MGFVVGHMLGNLQVFWGPSQINAYAVHLRDLGPFLWVIRIFLLTCFILHIVCTIALVRANRAARPVKYEYYNTKVASKASRTMAISGLIVLSFVIFHVLHFTFGYIDSQNTHYREFLPVGAGGGDRHDVYRMMIAGFQHWPVSFFYLLGIGLLCMHLNHGFASVFQTLGFRDNKTAVALQRLSAAFALVVFLGYCAIPTSVLLGVLTFSSHPFGN
jgi:succinate dehydrogenase / fumarate reductase cytochrome b subunit